MSSYRRKEAADFRKNVLEQYGLLDDDEDDDEVDANNDEEEAVAAAAGGKAEEEKEEDEVDAVKAKRPRLTPELLASRFDAFLGPPFRGLSETKSAGLWCAKLVRLYESWADSVFPQLALEVFLKRAEKASSSVVVKNALFELSRKRARIEEAEEDAKAEGLPPPPPPPPASLEAVDLGEQPIPDEFEAQAAPAVPAKDKEEEDDELILIFD
jgi:hypothetical protein